MKAIILLLLLAGCTQRDTTATGAIKQSSEKTDSLTKVVQSKLDSLYSEQKEVFAMTRSNITKSYSKGYTDGANAVIDALNKGEYSNAYMKAKRVQDSLKFAAIVFK